MFQLSLSSKELFHSNFLKWISHVNPELFKSLIKRVSKNKIDVERWGKDYTVEREKNNYDLCVMHNGEIVLVIENKVKSIPSETQLEEYMKETRNAQHMLLSLVGDFPHKEVIENSGWVVTDYGCLGEAIKSLLSEFACGDNDYNKLIMEDYAQIASCLHDLQKPWNINAASPYYDYDEDCAALRIADIREKNKFSQMAVMLKDRLDQILSNHGIAVEFGASKEKLFNLQNPLQHVLIERGMTRSQGLLSAKILIKENVSLLIQVQDKQYRHCIELNNTDTDKSDEDNWQIVSSNDDLKWFFRTEHGENPFVKLIDKSQNSEIKPSLKKKYNKYGKEFLYQSITIGSEATVGDVLDMVVTDITDIIKHYIGTDVAE